MSTFTLRSALWSTRVKQSLVELIASHYSILTLPFPYCSNKIRADPRIQAYVEADSTDIHT